MAAGSDDVPQVVPALNELLRVLCRSLPAYLADARPWRHSGNQQLCAALDQLVIDQQRYAQRVGETIVQLGSRPDLGSFPRQFAAKHDLAVEFLRQEVINQQEQAIPVIESCVAQLEGDASLHALAEEILGNARGHLDILKEMLNDE
jgi:bacterioferritin (cytochrome b1)